MNIYHNYEIIKEEELLDLKVNAVMLKHIKTKATILLFKNADINRSFTIAFNTPPLNDCGIPHILEHTVLGGSKKYPIKEPFNELLKSSFSTYLNAMTTMDKTIFPFSTANKKEFNNLMDIYLDGVFNPNIYNNKFIFYQEGIHIELDENHNLAYNGIVYNEMKGAYSSMDTILNKVVMKNLFPDNFYQYDSGGDPLYITDLKYEEFINYHKSYYHPSNCYIILYGDLDYSKILEYLDKEYLSKYEYLDIDKKLIPQKPFEAPKKVEGYYQAYELANSFKNYFDLSIAMPHTLSKIEKMGLAIINQVLVQNSASPIEARLLDENIGNAIYGSYLSGHLQDVFSISCKDAEEKDADKFISLIKEELNKAIINGLNKKDLMASINHLEYKIKEFDIGSVSKGILLSNWFLDSTYNFNCSFEFAYLSDICNELKDLINTNFYIDLIKKYLINNNHQLLTILKPQDNLLQEQNLKELKKLETLTKSLSQEDFAQLMEEDKLFKQYIETSDSQEFKDLIPTLHLKDIENHIPSLSNILESYRNYNILWHDYDTNDIMYVDLLFDIYKLDKNLIKYLGIYTSLLCQMDTTNYPYKELEIEIKMHTGSLYPTMFTSAISNKMYFVISIGTLENNLNKALDLTNEIMFNTLFNNKRRLKEILNFEKNKMEEILSDGGISLLITKGLSFFSQEAYLNNDIDGIGYYLTICNLLDDFDNQYNELINKLALINQQLFSVDNLIVSITGNNKQKELLKKHLDLIIDNLYDKNNHQIEVELSKPKNIVYILPEEQVASTALLMKTKHREKVNNGAILVLRQIIENDYLWQQIRVKGGAYGAGFSMNRSGSIYFTSYRDPNILNTFQIYQNVVQYIENLQLTKEELEKYIIGTLSYIDNPTSNKRKGRMDLLDEISNIKDSDKIQFRKEVVECKLADIKELANVIKESIQDASFCVIGNQEIIKNANIFDEIIHLNK